MSAARRGPGDPPDEAAKAPARWSWRALLGLPEEETPVAGPVPDPSASSAALLTSTAAAPSGSPALPPPGAASSPVAAASPPASRATASPEPVIPEDVAARAERFAAERAARTRSPNAVLPPTVAWLLAPPVDDGPITAALLRPPGSIEESAFLAGCTRCGDCARACPPGAITPVPARHGRAADTPHIVPEKKACTLCPDRPCATACAPKVIRHDLPAEMGSAVAKPQSCLNHLGGGTCVVCAERCPVPSALAIHGGRVTIDLATCTGCGICVSVCPAPHTALVVLPTAKRPPAPQDPHVG